MSYNFFTEKKKHRPFALLSPPKENKGTSKILQIIFTLVPVEKEHANRENNWSDQNQWVLTDLHFSFFLLYENILQHLREHMEAYNQDLFVFEWPGFTKTHRISKTNRPSSQQTDPAFRYKTWPSFIQFLFESMHEFLTCYYWDRASH